MQHIKRWGSFFEYPFLILKKLTNNLRGLKKFTRLYKVNKFFLTQQKSTLKVNKKITPKSG